MCIFRIVVWTSMSFLSRLTVSTSDEENCGHNHHYIALTQVWSDVIRLIETIMPQYSYFSWDGGEQVTFIPCSRRCLSPFQIFCRKCSEASLNLASAASPTAPSVINLRADCTCHIPDRERRETVKEWLCRNTEVSLLNDLAPEKQPR